MQTSARLSLTPMPVPTPAQYVLTVLRRDARKMGLLLPVHNPLRDPHEEDEFIDLAIEAGDDKTAALAGAQLALNYGFDYWEVRALTITTIAGCLADDDLLDEY